MTLLKTLEEFDDRYKPKVREYKDHGTGEPVLEQANVLGLGFELLWKEESEFGFYSENKEYTNIKNLIITSHIAHYKAEIDRLIEKQKSWEFMSGVWQMYQEEIQHYQDLIKEAEGLIK